MMPAIYGNSYQIVQAPGYVAILYEMIHETRVIPLDGRPARRPTSIDLDMGDARGRWEGDTLVVETRNFKERSVYRNANPDTLRSPSASRASARSRCAGASRWTTRRRGRGRGRSRCR